MTGPWLPWDWGQLCRGQTERLPSPSRSYRDAAPTLPPPWHWAPLLPMGHSHAEQVVRRAPVYRQKTRSESSHTRNKLCVRARSVWLLVTPWTVARQTPLSLGSPRQDYWSGLPFLPAEDLPAGSLNPPLLHLLHWQVSSLPLALPRKKLVTPKNLVHRSTWNVCEMS